jgi:uncharacterized membrane protein
MSGEPKKSELGDKEARRLADSATQTRFTWAVIFIALVTVLVGLLSIIEPFDSTKNPFFNDAISIIYGVLTFFTSYTFYAICHTSFILSKMIIEHEPKAIQDFLEEYWNPRYSKLIFVTKEKEQHKVVEFRTKTVLFFSMLVIIVSVLPVLLKLFAH